MMKTEKYRNDTGGDLNIPIHAVGSALVGAVDGWNHIETGKTFSAEVDEKGELVNPTLRVLAKAGDFGIQLASSPAPRPAKRKIKR
jgi:hypothetical protein